MGQLRWALPATALVVLGAAWALAQTAPPAGPPPFALAMRFHGGPRQLLCDHRDAVLAAALAFVRTTIEITPAEQQAWQRFSAAAESSIAPLAGACAALAQQHQPASLPDRLRLAETFAAAHLQVLQSIRPALAQLYQTLTPEQREQLDALPFGKR